MKNDQQGCESVFDLSAGMGPETMTSRVVATAKYSSMKMRGNKYGFHLEPTEGSTRLQRHLGH